jgi:sugar lactone lactonase YvrE
MSLKVWLVSLAMAGAAGVGFAMNPAEPARTSATGATVEQVAQFQHQVTGVTASERGRLFVNFPRWTEDTPVSVAEVLANGNIRPFPNEAWNEWRNARKDELSARDHWVCVQSVVADLRGNVWVLDPAAPAVNFIVPGGPKLVRIDLATNRVTQNIGFDESVAPQGSYLNDVRFSPDGRFAFITDAGARGALVVVDLASGRARRVLDGHPTTQPKKGLVVTTDGKPLRRPDGRGVEFAADGIALSNDGRFLYWQALTGDTLYRIPTSVLETRGLAGQDVSGSIESFGINGVSDGLWYARGSDSLYISSLEDNSIKVRNLAEGPGAPRRLVVQDPRLRWPDTFTQGPDGTIYVTTSRIQDSMWFKPDAPAALPTQLWRLRPAR